LSTRSPDVVGEVGVVVDEVGVVVDEVSEDVDEEIGRAHV